MSGGLLPGTEPIAGVTVAGPLPAEYGNDTIYCAARMIGAANSNAEMLIEKLIAPEGRDAWVAAGFLPPDAR